MPLSTAGYPIKVCRNKGSSAIVPYSTMPRTIINDVPTAKFLFVSTRRSTMGSLDRNSQMTNTIAAIVAVMTNQVMNEEANHSSSCPLSSTSCIAPSATAIKPKPM